MPHRIAREGRYQLFRSLEEDRVLVLEGEPFALVHGPKGEVLATSGGGRPRGEILRQGTFKLVEFERDARFRDTPHLFLEHRGMYDEVIVPRGLPAGAGDRRRFVETGHRLAMDDVDAYLGSSRLAGGAGWNPAPGPSIAGVTGYLEGVEFPADQDDLIDHARETGAPPEILEQLEKLEPRGFDSMDDVAGNLGRLEGSEGPGSA